MCLDLWNSLFRAKSPKMSLQGIYAKTTGPIVLPPVDLSLALISHSAVRAISASTQFFSQFAINVYKEAGCNHTSFSSTLPSKLRVCALSVCLDVRNTTIWEKMAYIPSLLALVARQSNKGKALCREIYYNYSVTGFALYKTYLMFIF